MNDTPTLVKFHKGWVQEGLGKDGLPLYRDRLMITKSRPPLLRLDLEATDDDIAEWPEPYALFQKEEAGRKTNEVEGYPLSLWPACSEAEYRILAVRDIYTVEQLAKLAGRGVKAAEGMPAEIRELADRAAKLMSLQKDTGKFEELIREKDGQIEALREQVEEAGKTIAAQKTVIDRLRIGSGAMT